MISKLCHCSNPSTPSKSVAASLKFPPRSHHDLWVVMLTRITKFRVVMQIVMPILPNLEPQRAALELYRADFVN